MREAETVTVTAVEETQGLTDQSCGVFAAMHSLSRPAEDPGGRMVRVGHGDLIGEYTDTCRLYEKYLGDGMYQLTYCVDGYDDARIEVSATTVGKTTLLDWITDQGKGIPGGPMLDMTPRRWQLAPGDGIFDGRQPEKFGSVCRCGALLAKAYRSAPRCTKCGFDPMEV